MCPWDGAGNFTRTNGDNTGEEVWQEDKTDGDKIVASRHDAHDQDLANGINACVAKNGENAAGVVETDWIKDANVTAAKLATDAVETAKIKDANVTTAKINDEAVTLAKMQHITSDRLLGRDTASSGDVEQLTVSGGLEFTGSGGIQIASDGVTTAKIADGNITEAKLADDAATRSTWLGQFVGHIISGDENVAPLERFYEQPSFSTGIVFPKSAKVTHASIAIDASLTSGSITATVYKTGSTTGQGITLSTSFRVGGALGSAVSVSVNDYLEVYLAGTFTNGSSDPVVAFVIVDLWGHFTA